MCLVHRVAVAADRRKSIPVSEVSVNFTGGCHSSCVTLPTPLTPVVSTSFYTAAALGSQSATGVIAPSSGLLPCVSVSVSVTGICFFLVHITNIICSCLRQQNKHKSNFVPLYQRPLQFFLLKIEITGKLRDIRPVYCSF